MGIVPVAEGDQQTLLSFREPIRLGHLPGVPFKKRTAPQAILFFPVGEKKAGKREPLYFGCNLIELIFPLAAVRRS